jgi:LPXTG-motif cell wall-anchored protein
MKPLTRALITLTAVGAAALTSATVASAGASASGEPIPVESARLQDWYVNPNEEALLPEQLEDGLLFDGPSLVHHSTNHTLATVPTDGTFDATVETGVAPPFKMETWDPYSTLNKTADGKWWTTKIATGDGSSSAPVDSPADLIGKSWTDDSDGTMQTYTDATTVFSFGVGYANDTGNKALVSSITYDGEKYDLTCWPPEPTTTASATAAPVSEAVAILPVTGGNSTSLILILIGFLLTVLGGVALIATRRRRTDV